MSKNRRSFYLSFKCSRNSYRKGSRKVCVTAPILIISLELQVTNFSFENPQMFVRFLYITTLAIFLVVRLRRAQYRDKKTSSYCNMMTESFHLESLLLFWLLRQLMNLLGSIVETKQVIQKICVGNCFTDVSYSAWNVHRGTLLRRKK